MSGDGENKAESSGSPLAPDAAATPPLLLGLSAASLYGSFTTAGSAVSMLYDSLGVAWNNGDPPPEKMPGTRFALVANDAARGQAFTLYLRGFCMPAGSGSLLVEIDGQATTLARAEEEEFRLAVPGILNADGEATRFRITLVLQEPAEGAAASLTLDSVDIGLPDPAAEETEEEAAP